MGWSMWLVTFAVCIAHLVLLGLFTSGGVPARTASLTGAFVTTGMTVRDVPNASGSKRQWSNLKIQPTLSSSVAPARLNLSEPSRASENHSAKPTFQAEVRDTQEEHLKTASTKALNFYPFNRENFLDFDKLDSAAVSSAEFEDLLSNVLPRKFEFLVLELLIDEAGRTVQISCLDGECSQLLDEKLQELLPIAFVPAVKDRSAVPSRKVIHVAPTPNYQL
jgi:hypothetical protein